MVETLSLLTTVFLVHVNLTGFQKCIQCTSLKWEEESSEQETCTFLSSDFPLGLCREKSFAMPAELPPKEARDDSQV